MNLNEIFELVGHVVVDSGQIILIDPCYLVDDDYYPDGPPTGNPYDTICRVTVGSGGHGEVLGGFATGTLYGDGRYPVYAEMKGDKIARLVISFDDDEEPNACVNCGDVVGKWEDYCPYCEPTEEADD
jgi:hypothetical protein